MLRSALILSVLPLAMGCSAMIAVTSTGPKDPEVLAVGTPRETVVAELGAPESFERLPDGGTLEIHAYKDGYPIWANILRGVAWAGADFFTLCLTELVTLPLETNAFCPWTYSARVIYDSENCVRHAVARDAGGRVIFSSGPESWRADELTINK